MPETERAETLAALAAVDAVTIFEEDTPCALLERLLPDVLVKGADWSHLIVGREIVEQAGGKVLALPFEAWLFEHRHRQIDPQPTNLILPAVKEVIEGLARHPSFEKVLAAARSPRAEKLQLSGLRPTAEALYAALLHDQTQRPVVIVVPSSTAAEQMCESASAFFDLLGLAPDHGLPLVLPGLDVTPYDGLSPHADIVEKRGIGLWRAAERSLSMAIVPVSALLLKTAPAEFYRNLTWRIEIGDEFYLEDLESGLVSAGYSRHEPVDMAGQYSIRGGIIDVYSPEAPASGQDRDAR